MFWITLFACDHVAIAQHNENTLKTSKFVENHAIMYSLFPMRNIFMFSWTCFAVESMFTAWQDGCFYFFTDKLGFLLCHSREWRFRFGWFPLTIHLGKMCLEKFNPWLHLKLCILTWNQVWIFLGIDHGIKCFRKLRRTAAWSVS